MKLPAPFRNQNFLMVAAMLAMGVAGILWAERLIVADGVGWDGSVYGSWVVKDFYNIIFVLRVPAYYLQRILPSAIVHYGMRLLGVPRTNPNILLSFQVYNLILILLSVYTWGLIADRLRISNKGKWLGFCFLFVNYAILKSNFYQPVLTDTSAFTLGALMFYFYLKDSRVGLLALMLVGGFTWPTVPYMVALLYVFPNTAVERHDPGVASARTRWNVLLAAATSGLAVVTLLRLTGENFGYWIRGFGRNLRIDYPPMYFSIAGIAAYLFFGLKAAAADPRIYDIRLILKSARWKRVLAVLLVMAFMKFVVHRFESGRIAGWSNPSEFIFYTLLSGLTEPLIFLVAHVVYYGPAIILLVLFWKPFCQSLSEFSIGLRLVVILNVILGVNPQSRFLINVVAVFVMLLVKLLDRYNLSYRVLGLLVVLSLFFSKVWYRFNTGPQVDDGTMDALQKFPLQHFFMSSGPWMSHPMYLVQGGVTLVTGLILYFLVARPALKPAFGGSRKT
jgi:hypothetical protein